MPGPYIHTAAITKELKIEGFIVTRYTSKYPEAQKEMKQWISEVLYNRFTCSHLMSISRITNHSYFGDYGDYHFGDFSGIFCFGFTFCIKDIEYLFFSSISIDKSFEAKIMKLIDKHILCLTCRER